MQPSMFERLPWVKPALLFILFWIPGSWFLCWTCARKYVGYPALIITPLWTLGLLVFFLASTAIGRKLVWKMQRHWAIQWHLVRVNAGKWNEKLDRSVIFSGLTWLIGIGSSVIVAFALEDKYKKVLPPDFPIKGEHLLVNLPLVWALLLFGPILALGKKALRKLEYRDVVAVRDLHNRLAENMHQLTAELVRHALAASAKATDKKKANEAWNDFSTEALVSIAARLALAFRDIAGVEMRSMKVIPCLFKDGILDDISIRAPTSAEARSSKEDLADPSTTIMQCFQKQRCIVISDIELEITKPNRRFSPTPSNPDGAIGSIIAYPVRAHDRVCCVFSIYCQEPRRFFEDDIKFYERELGTFGRLFVTSRLIGRKL